MAITKIVYVDGVTVIRAAQLNAWQDELIRLDSDKYEKPDGGIPKADLAAALQTLLDKAQDVVEAAESGDFDGEDGVSPTITVEEITGGHRVTITDATGTRSFDVMDGEGGGGGGTPGQDGYSPVVTITEITGGHRVTITSKAHPEGQTFDVLDGEDGSPGSAGADGVSPEISITNITGGHRVTITDEDHPQGQSFDVMDGADGSPGTPGAPGVSPEVSVETITGGHRVTITDASGTRSFDVMDGADGSPGTPGAPGVSPAVSITNITGGHRVTITDASGTQTFDVMDGQDAAQETKIEITLAASWTGSGPYTQTVTVSGGTASSIISLQPSIAQSAQLIQDGVKVLQIDNNNGTFTATAIGAAPSSALTLQATRREVAT